MSEQYIQNIKIADLTLELNPEQYTPHFKKYGSYKRAISGGIVDVDINGKKLEISISGLAQSQIEEIKKRVALNKLIEFIDYVPVSERGSRSRIVYEDLGSETIDSELIYSYIPTYYILIMDFLPTYSGNIVEYKLIGEEA